MAEIEIKHFEALTTEELYNIIQLRLEVYIVEQGWRYQDLDDLDKLAWHVMLTQEGQLIGMSRIYTIDEALWIGRVILSKEQRRQGMGKKLMQTNLEFCTSLRPKATIKLHAPVKIKEFYELHGFKVTGDTFLDEGVPYCEMTKKHP